MSTDRSRKPTKRKPTPRSAPTATAADSYYSKLTRKASTEPTWGLSVASTQHSVNYDSISSATHHQAAETCDLYRRRTQDVTAAYIAMSIVFLFIISGIIFWTSAPLG